MNGLNEVILEVRYKPNPRALDYRGAWAEAISSHMKLSEWRIVENRIDIHDSKNIERAFVGFKNAGYIIKDSPTKNYFPEKTSKFFKFLFSLKDFGKTLFVERLGLRTKFCKKYEGSFDELVDKYTTNFLSLSENAKSLIGAKLLDIGGPLNFVDKYGNFNTMSGPMVDKQMVQFFERSEGIPSVGLYMDIDYWLTPKTEMKEQEVLQNINQFAISAWDRIESISKLILE